MARKSRGTLQAREPAGTYRTQGMVEVSASTAKNHFGEVIAQVANGKVVAVKRHNETVGVIVPADEYQRMRRATSGKLNLLTAQFDQLVDRMQQPDFVPRARRALADMAEQAPAPVVRSKAAARHG
ncbi:MAG: type II toxin-antitoxin system Phd/YefM family antitoxin [Gammaproteobacteria bacterium]